MTAEWEFKHAVMTLVACKVYPSPRAINGILGHRRRFKLVKGRGTQPAGHGDEINGRECRWRREVCKEIGFRLKGRNL